MTEKAQHTKLPWKVFQDSWIVSPSGDAELGNWLVAKDIRWEEDAAFIVKACNNHHALISALEDIFALHEPEGRFQPSHYKPILANVATTLKQAKGE